MKIIKYLCGLLLLIFILLPTGSTMQSNRTAGLFNLSINDYLFIDSVLSTMSLKEKCAQMVMPNANGVDTSETSTGFLRLKKFIEEYKVGGLIFFKGAGTRQAIITNKLQAFSKIPLLIASDFERGLGMRLEDEIEFPYNMAFAATNEPMYSYFAGKLIAERSRAIGVRQNYAPLLDINRDSGNPVINVRAYSDNPETASLFGSFFIKGTKDGKMLSTAKHFPGHGATNLDSHNDLPLISLDKNELQKKDLYPFQRAILSGVQSIMIGHLQVPSLDTTKNLPATFSKNIVNDLLINEMNFEGLVVTDAMNMRSITQRYTQEIAAKLAVLAGNDILLYPENENKVIAGLIEAVEKGEISESRINKSVRKILSAKKYLGLFSNKYSNPATKNGYTDANSLHRFARDVAERSVTLLKDEKNIIPLNLKKYKSIACITITNSKKIADGDLTFGKLLKEKIKGVKSIELSGNSKERDYKKAAGMAKNSQIILLPAFISVRSSSNSISMSEKGLAFVKSLIALKKPIILMSFGTPYLISEFEKATTYLCAYGNPIVSQEAMLDAILGRAPVTGKLPITIPETSYVYGSGEDRINKIYFSGNEIDTLYNFSSLDTLMKRAIRESAFPGGALLVGHKGKVVYNKSFGSFTYEANAKKVKTTSLFDLASLTKVLATTPAAMLLADEGKINLDDAVIKYLPAFNNNGKEKITIRNLLLHNSGLPSFKPFYKTLKKADEVVSAIMNCELECEPGTKYLYSDLGMIVLQKVIESITKLPLDKFLKLRLYDKLEMKNTFFNPPKTRKGDCAPTELDNYWRNKLLQGEVHDEAAYMLKGVSGNAGLFSSAEDLAIFVNTLLNNGVYDNKTIFNAATVKNWTSKQSKQSTRGLGWDTKSDEKSSAGAKFSNNSFGHTGFTGTSIWVDKDKKLFVILLTNRVHPTRNNNKLSELRPKIHDAAIRAVEYF